MALAAPVEDDVEPASGALVVHLQAIQRNWAQLQRSHAALRAENAALRMRVAELEGHDPAAPTESDGRVRANAATDAADVIDLSLSPPLPRQQPLPAAATESAVAVVPAAPPPASAAAQSSSEGLQSQGESQQSPDSSDLLFNILFDGRKRKKRQHSRQQPADAAAPHSPRRPVERMEVEREADIARVEVRHQERHAESLSSADRLLLELEADEGGSTAANRGDDRAARDQMRAGAGVVEKAGEMHHATPAINMSQAQQQQPAGVVGDPFATQDLGGLAQLSPQLPVAAPADGRVVTTEEEAKAELSSVSVERRGAKECYLLHDYQQALSLYDSADQRLSTLIRGNPDRPFVLPLALPELATVLACRAAIHIKLGDLAAARADVDRLTATRPQWWKTLALEARVLVGERRFEEAVSVYAKGLQCDMSEEERVKMRQKKEDVERKWRHSSHRAAKDRHALHHADGGDSPMSFPLEPLEPPLTLPLPPSPRVSLSTPPSTTRAHVDADDPFDIHLSPSHAEPAAADALQTTRLIPPPPAPPPLPATQQLPASPSKASSQDYSLLPRITVEGVRDLLGSELFHRAEAAVSAVYKVKVAREEGEKEEVIGRMKGHGDGGGGEAVLVLAKCKPLERSSRKRRRVAEAEARPFQLQQEEGEGRRRPELLDVALRFRGNRVMDWSCTCSGAQAEDSKQEQVAADGRTVDHHIDAERPPWEDENECDHVDSALIPCRHVGAVLLLLRQKQSSATPPSMPTRQPPLFFHLSHALPAAVLASLPSVYERYAGLKVERLRSVLQLNGERQSGLKEELIERCVEGEVRGVLGKCARCGGSLFYANGMVHCKGVFDVERKVRAPCSIHLPEEAVQRRAWRSE